MISMQIHRAILVIIAAAVCWGLMRWLGRGPALGVWAGGMAAACAAATALLRSTKVGERSWKNRVAGILLPFGYGLSGGKLWPITVISWAVWVLVAVGVALQLGPTPGVAAAATAPAITTEPSPAGAVWRWLLFAAWALNAAAVIYVLGTLTRNFRPGSSSGRSLIKVIGLLLALTAGSVWLHWAGYTRSAALLAGAPFLVLGSFFGAIMALLWTAAARGKPIRWN